MNKKELAQALSEKLSTSVKASEDFLHAFEEIVTLTLKQGGDVTLTGFGSFSSKKRAARTGVNPKDPSQKIQIKASIAPKFKAGKGLKDALNG